MLISYLLYTNITPKQIHIRLINPELNVITRANLKQYTLNTKENTCICKYFVKYAYCSHLMALKELLDNDEFANKPKRERNKLAERVKLTF
ncbi:hypothetical protein BpHYR1_021889 [Brachionus plicatilis]|uniref:SWIM-type domain-containing protein n=1 Tax=Brachionus plicatilis TaxID=10195 RepID=A0A3M7SN09_BRAPC|nr:hypothetical protein BpHYR1_021889 [Brachionus plicatilis]